MYIGHKIAMNVSPRNTKKPLEKMQFKQNIKQIIPVESEQVYSRNTKVYFVKRFGKQ